MLANFAFRTHLDIVYQGMATPKPRQGNPRIHFRKQIAQIARAIKQFGFTNPVLVDDCNSIVVGDSREKCRLGG